MPLKRVFIGWNRPGLECAVEYLAERFGTALGGVIVATPGSRAGRRLLELLVHEAERRGAALDPPRIVTAGRLPEMLYTARKPFADDLTQQMAWVKALQQTSKDRLHDLVPAPPEEGDLAAWLSLGKMLALLHRELAADALDFKAVLECGAGMKSFHEEKRWRALRGLQEEYLAILSGLGLWDLQTARLFAIEHRECDTDKEIVLVGAADLNRALKRMLEPVSVAALVLAPEGEARRFDGHGCLKSEAWTDTAIELSDDRIEVADDPADVAARALRAVAGLDGRFAEEEVSIGVPSDEVVPYLKQHLEQLNIPSRYGVGIPIQRSAPYRALKAAADYVETRRYSAFAELVRHPSFQAKGIEGVDEYFNDHLPFRLDGKWLGKHGSMAEAYDRVEKLLVNLRGKPKPLSRWSDSILGLLAALYGDEPKDPAREADRIEITVCEKIQGIVRRQETMHASLMPVVSGAEALNLTLRQLAGETIPPLPVRGAVELLGWLELMLDDAPALIVTGMNEGHVPSSHNADLFLPDGLRTKLGIEDNDRRYARDAYALTVLARSREELHLIAGRRTREGEPLQPSRLLFACDEEKAARRALAFFKDSPGAPVTLEAGSDATRLPIVRPEPLPETVTSMRVTEFSDYLACPYRYYLRHHLRLEGVDDRARELDGRAFGSLAHSVLKRFGQGPCAASADAAKIEAWLVDCLRKLSAERYGENAMAAVRVQVEQLKHRLASFARWQAAWVEKGWRIEHVETGPEEARLMVDGVPMGLRGRIDRIDRHSVTGDWIVFDYKTSDTAKKPEAVHRGWADLQLPLYRHLAAALGIDGNVSLAYIALPKGEVRELIAGWSKEDLQEADRVAEEVVRQIRNEVFWPPSPEPPHFADDLSALCQDGHLGSGEAS